MQGKYVMSGNLLDRLYENSRVKDASLWLASRPPPPPPPPPTPPTKVINKKVDEKLLEPYKIARVEVPEHMGAVDPRLRLRKEQVPLTPYSVHRRTNVYWSWSECLQRINCRYSSTKEDKLVEITPLSVLMCKNPKLSTKKSDPLTINGTKRTRVQHYLILYTTVGSSPPALVPLGLTSSRLTQKDDNYIMHRVKAVLFDRNLKYEYIVKDILFDRQLSEYG
ncbi:hypothetical protein SAY87_008410 [Trapa incisa]|uniref:Uncharacterized protein n=1 Tax=Trapa incisa TaxID=236973 RepID=A0AAN7KD77_9MYRT|nr:hypothetical protein SAY87_008410 [Trapa incisa]